MIFIVAALPTKRDAGVSKMATETGVVIPTMAASPDENRIYAKVFWRFVPFLMLCYVAAYLDRVNVGFAKLQMSADLGFSETADGLGAGIFFLGYFLFEVPSNLVLSKLGARVWLARIMISWGLISACFMFVRSTSVFYLLRFLLGAAEAGFYPAIIFYLTCWFPSQRRAKVIAIFMAAIPIAGIFGNPLSGWIMVGMAGAYGLPGWQWLFLIEALPALVLGVAIYFYLDNDIRDAAWLTEDEKRLLERNLLTPGHQQRGAQSLTEVFCDPRVWLMCFIYFAFVMGQYGLTFWMPTLVKYVGVTGDFSIGMVSAIPFTCAAIAMVLFGRSADRHRERRWHLVVPALLGALGFIAAANTGSTVLAVACLSLAAAGVITCAPLFWSLPTAFLSGTAAAVGIAAINSVGNLAGFVSPYLIGTLTDLTGSSRTGMYVLAIMLIAGAMAVLRTSPQLVNR